MSDRQGVTVIAPIEPGRLASLRQLLCDMARDPGRNDIMPFGAMREVHFARWVIIPDDAADIFGEFPPQLLYASEFDPQRTAHFERILDTAEAGLDRILEHCVGYPPPPLRTRPSRLRFLTDHGVPFGPLYESTTGTVEAIRAEATLRDRIEDFLDDADWRGRDPLDVHKAVREYVSRDAALRWALEPRRDRGAWWFVRHWVYTLGAALGAVVLLPITMPLTLVWLATLRLHEKREPAAVPSGNTTRVTELTGYEDRGAQNQLTVLAVVKRGWFRRFTLWGVLRFFYLLVDLGIPFAHAFFGVKTIHFARFQRVDGGRRLLFMSNYDGSWESYLGDFVDRLSFGISGVWSNAEGFPETHYLLFGGARHEQVFKALVRDHQLPPAVWYSAYPYLTVENIKNNAAIRDGLTRSMSRAQATTWLQRL